MFADRLTERHPRTHRVALAAALLLAMPLHAQDAAKPPPSFWDQLKDGIGKGVEQTTGGDLAGRLARDVQDGLEGRLPQRVGHVVLGNGRYLTYFEGDARGFPSAGRPLERKPAPGEPGAWVPLMVVPLNARNGRSFEGGVVANNVEEMRRNGFLVADTTADAATAGTATFDPRGNCATVPPALRPKYRGRCVSFDADDPCSALPADGSVRNGQTALAGACDARRDRAVIDKVNAYKPKPKPPDG